MRRAIGEISCWLVLVLCGFLTPAVTVGADTPATGAKAAALAPLPLSLRGALDAAVDNNPDVLLYRERIEAARGQVLTQLGAMLPNIAGNVRQSRQTQFLGSYGLSPVRSDPFSIFDTRLTNLRRCVEVASENTENRRPNSRCVGSVTSISLAVSTAGSWKGAGS